MASRKRARESSQIDEPSQKPEDSLSSAKLVSSFHLIHILQFNYDFLCLFHFYHYTKWNCTYISSIVSVSKFEKN